MKFVVENVSHFLIASQVSAPWKMPICRKLATDDRLGHDPSRMMTRRNELTGSSLILFWQVSSLSLSLSSASTSNECNLPRCFFTE